METPVFDNEFFDRWLSQKSAEVLAKLDKEKITNEDMLILSLKAQVNHFHHMDIEFREEFTKIDKRFEQVDKRFDRLTTILMWGFGLFVTTQAVLIVKSFI